MLYNRFFINLNQVDSNYAIKNKKIIGRCKIEKHGNFGQIYVWVQNLKSGKYDFYLISKKTNSFHKNKIGEIKIDERGYGELNFNFDTNNSVNQNLNCEEINIVALTIKDKILIVAEGYKNNSHMDWHDNFKNNFFEIESQIKNDDPVKKINSIEAEKNSVVKNLDEKNNSDCEHKKNNDAETKFDENKICDDENKTKITNDLSETEKNVSNQNINQKNNHDAQLDKNFDAEKNNGEKVKSDKNKIFDAEKKDESETNLNQNTDIFRIMAEKIKQELDDKRQTDFMTQKNLSKINYETKNDLDFLFEINQPIKPFETQKKEIDWVCLSLKEISFLPIDFWNLINHPFIFYAYLKNKHFILGREKNNQNKFIFGVPDKYQPEYKTCMQKFGFQQFKSCHETKNIFDDDGYWLMSIDF